MTREVRDGQLGPGHKASLEQQAWTQGLFQNSQGLGTSLVRNCQVQDMGFPWDKQSGLGDGQGLSRSALPKLCMCELILTLLLIQSDQVLDPVIDPIKTSLLSASPAPST